MGQRPTQASPRSSTSELDQIDLRLVFPAIGAWAAAGVGVGHDRWTGLVLGVAIVVGVLAAWRRVWLACGTAAIVIGSGLVAWSWAGALASSQPAQWAASGAFVEVTARVSSDVRSWEPSGNRPAMSLLPVHLAEVSARGENWLGSLPAVVRATGEQAADLNLPAGSTVHFVAIATSPEVADRSVATLLLRGPVSVVEEPGIGADIANRFRSGLRDAVAQSPPEQAGLVPSLVVGDTARLPDHIVESFRSTGLSHLVAVSGTNFSLLLVVALAVARQVGVRGWTLRLLAVGVAAGFVVVCRAEPSVLRAAAMGLIALGSTGLARHRGRGVRTLCVAVMVLVVVDPWLARSVGFALSVCATAGILWWGSGWQRAMRQWAPGWLAESLAIPLAAQLATQPVVTAISGQVSVVALVANVAAGPFVGPVTILGLAAGLLSLLSPPLAAVVGWAAGWCVQPIVIIASLGSSAPAATWTLRATPATLTLLAAICLVTAQFVLPAVVPRRSLVVGLGVALLVAAFRAPAQVGWPGDWAVVACDVGQGGAVVIRAGPHAAILVDTGPDADPLDRCLASLGVRQIPLLVITHPHADHIGGLAAIGPVEGVRMLLTTPVIDRNASWIEAAGALPTPQATSAGEVIQVGEARWTTLAAGPVPGALVTEGPDNAAENDAGVVGLVEVGGLRVLVTGDLEVAGQQALVASGQELSADVLVVPHHGSPRQDRDFLCAVGARIALIQVGERNDYGHPAASALALLSQCGAQVFRTDQHGALAVEAGADRVVTQR